RAAHYRMPLVLAIIGGDPRRFLPFAELYRASLAERGAPQLPLAVHSHGYVAESDAKAREELYQPWSDMRNRIGAERGWPRTTRREFDAEIESGSLYVGAPETVARKIVRTARLFDLSLFDIKYSAGT